MKKILDIVKQVARDLRKRSTQAEQVLWEELKWRQLWGYKFLRQQLLYVYTENSWLDRFIIPDFICLEHRLIVEIDWSIHDTEEIYLLDRHKEFLVKKLGFHVLRFTNAEVLGDILKVLREIKKAAATLSLK